MQNPGQKSARKNCRSGAVVTEFAICLPILLLFFFGSLEFARVNMIRQSVDNAAYEACRRGIVPGATAESCRDEALVVLNSISVENAEIDIEPTTIDEDTTDVTVTITVPINDNSWVAPFFFSDKSVSSTLSLSRERFNNARVP